MRRELQGGDKLVTAYNTVVQEGDGHLPAISQGYAMHADVRELLLSQHDCECATVLKRKLFTEDKQRPGHHFPPYEK